MRFFVLQNGLDSRATHYFNESMAWREECAKREIGCRIYVHRKAPPDIVRALDATVAFAYGPDEGIPFEPDTQLLHDLVHKGDRFSHECRLLDAHHTGPGDVVIMPYAGGAEMLGLARWMETRRRPERPRVVTIAHRPGDDWRFDEAQRKVVAGTTAPLRYGARRLAKAAGEDRCLLGATSGHLAAILTDVVGLNVFALPVMQRYLQAEAVAEGTVDSEPLFRGRRFDVGLLGEFRPEKGGMVALRALRRLFDGRRLAALVQVADSAQAERVRDEIRGASGHGGVTLLKGELSSSDFETCVGACRLLLLPYNPQRYIARVSGLLVEAAGWGRPVVAPAGTWMAEMVESGRVAGVLFERFDADAVRNALGRALDDIDVLTTRADELAPAWRQAECMEAAVARIAAWAAGSNP